MWYRDLARLILKKLLISRLSSATVSTLVLNLQHKINNYLTRNTYVRHILNVSAVTNYYPEDFTYLKVELDDDVEESILHLLEKPIEFIKQYNDDHQLRYSRAIENRSAVLVHCSAGVSRSATVVIAYLMKYRNMTLCEAFMYVKERRSVIQPNEGYMRQLVELDKQLFGKESFSLIDYYVQTLSNMGFQKDRVIKALQMSQNKFELAVSILVHKLGGT